MSYSNFARRMGAGVTLAAVIAGSVLGASMPASADGGSRNAIYVSTNDAAGNAIAVYNRADDGTLTAGAVVPTGGRGTGAGLGSQGAVVLAKNGKWLLAVNAGSNEISAFQVSRKGLRLTGKIGSGGQNPTSVTLHDEWVYVLNAGGPTDAGNITGFELGENGELSPLAGSTQPLSNQGTGASTAPAQIQFSPEGGSLVVTERATNKIVIYPVNDYGIAGAGTAYASAGATPFGFTFDKREHLLVSEAFGGAPNASALSSYDLPEDGPLTTLSPSVATQQTAACWVVATKNGKFAYTTNTGSASVSGYRINRDGTLSLLKANGVSGTTGAGPIDMGFSNNSRFLYTLNGRADSISVFRVEEDGELWPVQEVIGVPVNAAGLASR